MFCSSNHSKLHIDNGTVIFFIRLNLLAPGNKSPLARASTVGKRPQAGKANESPQPKAEESSEERDTGTSSPAVSQGLSSPPTRLRRSIRQPNPSLAASKKVSRQNTDESGDEKRPSSSRSIRSRTASASPRTKSPAARPARSLAAGRSPFSGSTGAVSTGDVPSSPSCRRADTQVSSEVRHLVAFKEGVAPLGLRICGGRGLGVFVDSVASGSVTELCGMRVGDQVLKVGW